MPRGGPAYLERLRACELGVEELGEALRVLSRMLHDHHGVGPLVLIDEYDTPIHNAYVNGFYPQMVAFMRTLFGRGLKDNPYRSRAVLTGILRVAKESLFSGPNNLDVNTVLDERYSSYFGFTTAEVRTMAHRFNADDRLDELFRWYDGYRFGSTDLFNPWSVVNYFSHGCAPEAYWHNTGDSSIIADIAACATPSTMDNLRSLLKGASIQTPLDTNVVYPQLKGDPASIYSFLLMAGYLKATDRTMLGGETSIYTVSIPNLEIRSAYRKEVLNGLNQAVTPNALLNVQIAILQGDGCAIQEELGAILLSCASFFDTAAEAFYHGLLLGLCAMLEPFYHVTSNREAGTGRYDICLVPRRDLPSASHLPGIVIEVKAAKDADDDGLERLAQAALDQIGRHGYALELEKARVVPVYAYGMAYCGKRARVAMETVQASGRRAPRAPGATPRPSP